MTTRNLSPQVMFEKMAGGHTLCFHFLDMQDKNVTVWKAKAWPQVLATLGDFPAEVEPKPELLAEWEHAGLHKQRWIIDVEVHTSATFLINYPSDYVPGEKRPAILCRHGHGIGAALARDGRKFRGAQLWSRNGKAGVHYFSHRLDWQRRTQRQQ